ncbi:MAG: histidinol phosphatase, partial [Sinomicrobium sp.]|nr:histidinol phosphatase [Sinomicrobium sp.]
LQELGYRKLITTPHIYRDIYPNKRQDIWNALKKVQEVLTQEQINVELHAAAEYFLDEHFEELLEKKELLTLPGTNLVLIESSFIAPPPKLEEYLFQLQIKGYQPLIAHPERYPFWHHRMDKYERLKEMDCLLQLNLLSLSGRYGQQVLRTAEQLLKKGMIDFLGTDLHHRQHLEGLAELQRSRTFSRLMENQLFRNNIL